jgi:hypothetical protein
VRALRLSSRPPKAGAPLPADLATRLIDATNAALSSDTASDRWATVLDALSFSPIHLRVEPASIPAEPDETLLTALKAAASRLPQIAARFGIDPATAPAPPRRGGPQGGRRRPARKPGSPPPVPPPPPLPDATPATPEAAVEDVAVEDVAVEDVAPAPAPEPQDEAVQAPVPEPGTPEAEPAPVASDDPEPPGLERT